MKYKIVSALIGLVIFASCDGIGDSGLGGARVSEDVQVRSFTIPLGHSAYGDVTYSFPAEVDMDAKRITMLIPDTMDLTSMDMAVQIPAGAEIVSSEGESYPYVDENTPVSMSGMDMSTSAEITVRNGDTTAVYAIVFTKTPEGYVPIFAEENFTYVRSNLSSNYILMKDIALTANFEPIAGPRAPFIGIFDGNGKTISNLKIVKDQEEVGFFSRIGYREVDYQFDSDPATLNGKIHDLILRLASGDESVPSITGTSYVGALAGVNNGLIERTAVIGGVIKANSDVGGVVGLVGTSKGIVRQSYSSVTVIGTASSYANIGGVVGNLVGSTRIHDSYAIGETRGNSGVGAVVGKSGGEVLRVLGIGKVTATSISGGIAGWTSFDITTSYFDRVTTTQTRDNGASGILDATPYYTVDGVVRVANNADAAAITQGDFSHLDFVGNSDDGSDDIWYWVGDGEWPILQWQNP